MPTTPPIGSAPLPQAAGPGSSRVAAVGPSAGLVAALALMATSAFAQGNPDHGKQVFQDNCSGCHVLIGEGYAAPPLAGVFGRKAGTVPGFAYSDAMKKSGIV